IQTIVQTRREELFSLPPQELSQIHFVGLAFLLFCKVNKGSHLFHLRIKWDSVLQMICLTFVYTLYILLVKEVLSCTQLFKNGETARDSASPRQSWMRLVSVKTTGWS